MGCYKGVGVYRYVYGVLNNASDISASSLGVYSGV